MHAISDGSRLRLNVNFPSVLKEGTSVIYVKTETSGNGMVKYVEK